MNHETEKQLARLFEEGADLMLILCSIASCFIKGIVSDYERFKADKDEKKPN
jgi:hypothetical protein